MSRTISTYVEVGLDEFDDDCLINEVIDRELVPELLSKVSGKPLDETRETPRDLAEDALLLLMANRTEKAITALRNCIATIVPAELLAAHDALLAGDTGAATAELDRYISPTPAATATTLPKREATP